MQLEMSKMSSLQKDLLKKNLPPLPPGSFLQPKGGDGRKVKRHKRNYSPLPWSDFFERYEDIKTHGNCFRVYFRGSSGPVLLLLHGGGHSALSWAVFTVAISSLMDCQVVAMDIRGHGNTVTENDEDLSAETLVNDVGTVAEILLSQESLPIVLMGHSMGGALAVRAAAAGVIPSVVGLAVIDVVEGTAMDALVTTQSFLRGRPSTFKSLEEAIEWSIRSGQLRNVQSARVSMPGQVKRLEPVDVSRSEPTEHGIRHECSGHLPSAKIGVAQETIAEEEDEGNTDEQDISSRHDQCTVQSSSSNDEANPPALEQGTCNSETSRQHLRQPIPKVVSTRYSWRIDLTKTESYWQGWFVGLSSVFLSCPVPKMLILAGVDRLDKELTIGQMQGKFQMQVLSGCGHAVHEDVPDKVAEVIAGFLVRHRFAQPKEGFERPFPAC